MAHPLTELNKHIGSGANWIGKPLLMNSGVAAVTAKVLVYLHRRPGDLPESECLTPDWIVRKVHSPFAQEYIDGSKGGRLIGTVDLADVLQACEMSLCGRADYCRGCDGYGMVGCPDVCEGGEVPCHHCGQPVECERCRGEGSVPCNKCDGKNVRKESPSTDDAWVMLGWAVRLEARSLYYAAKCVDATSAVEVVAWHQSGVTAWETTPQSIGERCIGLRGDGWLIIVRECKPLQKLPEGTVIPRVPMTLPDQQRRDDMRAYTQCGG